jgi:hypothetical protein
VLQDEKLKTKSVKASIKVGNILQLDTNLGSFISFMGDVQNQCEIMQTVKHATAMSFGKLYRQKPKTWQEGLWMVKIDIARIGKIEDLKKFENEIKGTDLLTDDDEFSKLIKSDIKQAKVRILANDLKE